MCFQSAITTSVIYWRIEGTKRSSNTKFTVPSITPCESLNQRSKVWRSACHPLTIPVGRAWKHTTRHYVEILVCFQSAITTSVIYWRIEGTIRSSATSLTVPSITPYESLNQRSSVWRSAFDIFTVRVRKQSARRASLEAQHTSLCRDLGVLLIRHHNLGHLLAD